MKKIISICMLVGLLLFVLGMAWADDMGKTQTVNGWISDSQCGAKGAHEGAAGCTKKCIESGAKMVVVTDGDQKILTVENPDALKGHEGHHVAVTGQVKGDAIHVEKSATGNKRSRGE